ncbi:MAG: ATP-binding protein [Caldilineaceae bacterium]
MLKPLPFATQTFRTIVEDGLLYVDKTAQIYELIRHPNGVYFLSRPRRFGKSLLISTLEEIFKGEKELFHGLWLYTSDYAWQPYPVLRIDFSWHNVTNADSLQLVIDSYIAELAEAHGVQVNGFDYQSRFRNLISQLGKKSKVVILIDEYDKPILDNVERISEAQRIRDILKNFYTIIKSMDRYIRFVLITGISKFSRVGIFSGMNNLLDLTLHPRFATLLGITEDELRSNFADYLTDFAQNEAFEPKDLLTQMRYWYDGFRFTAEEENVYNPYSLLHSFHHRRLANFWFESGTPTFLIKLIKERQYDVQPLEALEVPELSFSTYEIERLELIPLLFQTGYLTIKGYRRDEFGELYTLSYPNYEVKSAFLSHLLSDYNQTELALSESLLRRLLDALGKRDLVTFFNVLDVFFANIDYDLQVDHEKYYQTIFYLIFLLLGVRVTAEVKTNQGRIDVVIELTDHIFLFEFKLDGSAEDALQQIKGNEYYQKYALKGKTITLVGANFESKQRKVVAWKSEEMTPLPTTG